ncbi:CDP-glucose 4,6-dehydratase [Desulfosporosinus sp. PR]|uniref:CDP-glucose 4,6-dehydratase n=1 Tax=Candidatus Desulfosporosinus nitrosoreducens TaxID=3401928 RepID=UPI0027F10AFE|nr:CDP-glucose 4,6-dehydratase [Desulfosporosinus sp. PR]MDQ7096249.1 CDP-glucose 4,6-dehydratase [Desulfosporosinus sp. PR]
MVSLNNFWLGKRVFITGHTGFKGSWLSLWLQTLGAEVCGYSLQPPSNPSLFELTRAQEGMISIEGNILDLPYLHKHINQFKPEIIIHMAAQSLVRHSYQFPIDTLAVNIMGTAHLLEAVRRVDSVRVAVNVTSDKCYENREWLWGYRENDPMGGHDPYSCSKGCAELVTSSYRRSYFMAENAVQVATARAGNVIGGGDWATDRIIPDCFLAIRQGEPIFLRNPEAVRPWQHVLEPLAGYLRLAEMLWFNGQQYAESWNFGPDDSHAWRVQDVVETLCSLWGKDAKWIAKSDATEHEAHYLKLDSSKAVQKLGWARKMNMFDTLSMTVEWYKNYYNGADPWLISTKQIQAYQKLLEENDH